jgi:hypothetical protein
MGMNFLQQLITDLTLFDSGDIYIIRTSSIEPFESMFRDYQEQALSRDMFKRSPLKMNTGERTPVRCIYPANFLSHRDTHQALSAQVSPISAIMPNAHRFAVQGFPIMSVISNEPQNLLNLRSSVAM